MRLGSRGFRLLEIFTVGFPFCAFKVLTGLVVRSFAGGDALGWLLVALGGVDLLLNVIALGFELAGRASPLPVCTAQWVVVRLGAGRPAWSQLGLSLDAMLSFTLVALMIGLGWLARLPGPALAAWSLGVVLNVLGAGVGRLAESVLDLEARR
jgi:hypothetical protein